MHTYKEKVNIITLGCSKNTVDSEKIALQLQKGDYLVSHNESHNCDTVIINTCGFIEAAKTESIETIIAWTKEKEKGIVKKVIVTGCLSQRYRDELASSIPEVDAWFGTMEMANLLHSMKVDYKTSLVGERVLSTPSHYAYLKISEGCNRTCSFCAIPLMRGKHVSRPLEELVSEAENLVANGVKEIMLIAQELTYYGLDIYKQRSLHLLLEKLAQIKGLHWIRLHYAYPHKFPMEIIDVMKAYPNICNYIDIPLQHASDPILQSMQRQITQKDMRELLHSMRTKIPDMAIRTTMMVGYPGETDQDFETLLNFVKEQRFDRLGVFMYSNEEGTSAASLPIQAVKDRIKKERYETLMLAQQTISEEKNLQTIGEQHKVIIDRKEQHVYVGRTQYDSPEVDNEVVILGAPPSLQVGDFVEVKITQADAYDRESLFLKTLS